jgi:Fe-S cluster assembly ATP-binding protein
MFKINNLKVSIDTKEIIHSLNLEINKGEVHALMGQNGSGKSTLAQAVMGHPKYQVDGGEIAFEGEDLLAMDATQRAKAGIFLSFQYPSEVAGVNISNYLRMIYNKKNGTKVSPVKFREIIKDKLEILDIKLEFLARHLNEGFSGGEKKRMEMLQMLVLEPKLAILDEVDSGLDIDALKIVSKAVNYLTTEKNMSVLIITHYTRVLNYIKPDFVHVMKAGQIVKSGGHDLAHELEAKGYIMVSDEALEVKADE